MFMIMFNMLFGKHLRFNFHFIALLRFTTHYASLLDCIYLFIYINNSLILFNLIFIYILQFYLHFSTDPLEFPCSPMGVPEPQFKNPCSI